MRVEQRASVSSGIVWTTDAAGLRAERYILISMWERMCVGVCCDGQCRIRVDRVPHSQNSLERPLGVEQPVDGWRCRTEERARGP